ncbi:MAG: PKD domain-containing protein [Candidatus Bathyarchaeota archaeon]|nr:PKD domain-containing protein [Candidatus Bathyarchaeota archaeon]
MNNVRYALLVFTMLFFVLLAPFLFLAVVALPLEEFDFVDINTSNVDGVTDIGTHTDFTAQQAGPDSIYDSLTEEAAAATSITYENSVESNSATGQSSHNFNYPLQTGSGNERLVVVTVSWEDAQASASISSLTIASTPMTKIADVTAGTGYSEYISLWYLLDSSLPSSSGSCNIAVTTSESITREIYVAVAEYSGVKQSAPDDYDTHANPSSGNTAITLTATVDGSLVVAGVGEGGESTLTATNNINNLQEQILTSSGSALGHHMNVVSGNIVIGWNNLATREGMAGAVWQPSENNFALDLEVQWTNANYTQIHEELCIFGGSMDSESIQVHVWSGSAWQIIFVDLSAGWNNISVSEHLVSQTFTIRFNGGTETGDTISDSWEIDCTLLHTWGDPPIANFLTIPDDPYTDETVTFNASASYDPDGTIESYAWDFGDGSNGTGETASHSFTADGIYTVTLTITDDDDLQDTVSTNITVLNRSPLASFSESATLVFTDSIITFNASSSYDSDGSIVSYFWTFGDGQNTTGMITQHTYTDDGTYIVNLTITDDDSATDTTTSTITVINRSPVASFTKSSETAYTVENLNFNASLSHDPDGDIVSYFWIFGDGLNSSGVVVSHAYSDDGVYVVTLTVMDDDSAVDTSTATLTILNRSPIASFTESAETVYTAESILFNASLSYDPDGDIVSYFWDFGDGVNATGVTVAHEYVDDGVYTVTLTVMDDDGASASVTAVKTVLNRLPVAVFTESASTVQTNEVIDFNASLSYDPDGDIVSYFWIFGDGLNSSGVVVSHAYSDDGVYVVTLTVMDDDSAVDTSTATKTVLSNSPPIASFTESAETVYTGEPIYFDASASYDPDGIIVSYLWDFGDGTNATGTVVEHAYAIDGIFTVGLTVVDDDGALDYAQATKTVLPSLSDVGITNIVPSNTEVYIGDVLNVSVTVLNEGTGYATFNVTLYRSEVYGWRLVEIEDQLVWYSGEENLADFLLVNPITVPAENTTLTFETMYDIENLYDFGFVQISTDEGLTWVSLENSYTTYNHEPNTNPEIATNLPGLTGTNEGWPEWKTMTFSLGEYAEQTVLLGFRYMTDIGRFEEGWYINNIAMNGYAISNQAFEQINPPQLQAIQTLTVDNLAPASQRSLTFSWNTTDTFRGRYFLSAVADPIVGEIDLPDNSFVNGIVEVKANPDLDGDGDVDIFDVVMIASLYGCKEGEADWNPKADLVADGEINIFDVVEVAASYGRTLPI